MLARANCAGLGTPLLLGLIKIPRAREQGMRGRRFLSMRLVIWCSFRRAAPARTITEDFARATISGRTRLWPCELQRANSCGDFRWCTTKMGRVFVLNRLNGAPFFPVEERPVIKSDIPGEESWPTQPASTISLVPEGLSVEDAWGKNEKERAWCAEQIKTTRS